jgi:DNA-binding beta-propeller fold protein YncE
MISLRLSAFISILLSIIAVACKKDKLDYEKAGYPDEIADIVLNKCATSGCHNELSKSGAAGLSLETWDALFRGGSGGSVVIPYRADQSTLCFYINTYDDLGLKLVPTMPYAEEPLSREEVIIIQNWINSGAANRSGYVKFSENPQRKKIYVANQGTDLVTVFDAESGLAMRYITVGASSSKTEIPHMIRISPDQLHWYAIFSAGTVLQKFRTSDDSYLGEVNLSTGTQPHNWNTFVITADSKGAYVADWGSNGTIKYVNLESMQLVETKQVKTPLFFPHGMAISKDSKILYATAQLGNFIYKIDISVPENPVVTQVTLQPGQTPSVFSQYDPHQVLFSPDGSKYFVSCQRSNELRIFKASNDSLIKVITTGSFPQEMALSESHEYLFVSCTEDTIQPVTGRPANTRGAITVINYGSNSLVKHIYPGFQPHGLSVDKSAGMLYVANRNIGGGSHHTTGGKSNGYLSKINISSLELVQGYRPEVSVDPYSVFVRD